jgi:hypothetical protein
VKDKAPNPECVSRWNGGEKNVVIDEGIEPVDAADEGIEKKVQDDVRKGDCGDHEPISAFQQEAHEGAEQPKHDPNKGEVGPVVVMERGATVDEIKIQEIDVWKNARDQADPKTFRRLQFPLKKICEEISGREVRDEHRLRNQQSVSDDSDHGACGKHEHEGKSVFHIFIRGRVISERMK